MQEQFRSQGLPVKRLIAWKFETILNAREFGNKYKRINGPVNTT
jgi:hypothetical protein